MAFDYSSSFSGINTALAGLGKQLELNRRRQTLAELGQDLQAGNYAGAAQRAFEAGDAETGFSLATLGQSRVDQQSDAKLLNGLFGGASPSPATASAAPAVNIGNPNEIETRFLDTVKGAGLTNAIGLGAVAAYGNAESKYAPGNVNRTWNDPSQSGQPGQAGGIMSWREERLRGLRRFAEARGEQGNGSPETQALYLAQEEPNLIPRLSAARTPQEANRIMADAWRFAGYQRDDGETARRLALTQQYADRFGGQGGGVPAPSPVVAGGPLPPPGAQTAQALPGDDPARLRADAEYYAQSNPEAARQFLARAQAAEAARGRVQVAETEEDVRRLEGSLPPANQVAQAGAPAQVVISGTNTVVDQEALSNNPKILNLTRGLALAKTEMARNAIKAKLDLEIADAKQRQAANAPTDAVRNYRFYRQEEQAAGRNPMSFQEFRKSTSPRTRAPRTEYRQPN